MGNGQSQHSDEKILHGEQPSPINPNHMFQSSRSLASVIALNRLQQPVFGTATFIAKNLLLTAAHIIYDKEKNYESKDIKIFISPNGLVSDYYEADAWMLPQKYKTCRNDERRFQHDYAIIKLKDNPGRPIPHIEFPQLRIACETCLTDQNPTSQLCISGYPLFQGNCQFGDAKGKTITLKQFGLIRPNRIHSFNKKYKLINYTLSTMPGQSGAPLLFDGKLIGCHVGGQKKVQYNIGKMLTFDMMDNINRWLEQLNCQPFTQNINDYCDHLYKQKIKVPKPINPLEAEMMLQGYKKQKKIVINSDRFEFFDMKALEFVEQLSVTSSKANFIDLRKNKLIKSLTLKLEKLKSLNIQKNKKLTILKLACIMLSSIDLSGNSNLSELYIHDSCIEKIDLSENTQLTQINFKDTGLGSINIGKLLKLKAISIISSPLKAIQLSYCTLLTRLKLRETKLTEVDLSPLINLIELTISNCLLKLINISQNRNLESVELSKNQLDRINLEENVNIKVLNLYRNKLKYICLKNNINLQYLDLNKNLLEYLLLPETHKLTYFNVSNNLLQELTVYYSPNLNFYVQNQSDKVCVMKFVCQKGMQDQCKVKESSKIEDTSKFSLLIQELN